ncbi:MAG: cryptochrome/photolyase family protein [Flavobacteriales bacterium]
MITLFWFRRDLRLHDNTGLFQALQSGKKVLPIFIFDTLILDELKDKNDRRVNFIHQSLERIHSTLLQYHSSLMVLQGTPLEAFQKIANEYEVSEVFTNHDYEPYAIQRDSEIAAFLKTKNIAFHSFKDQVMFEKNEVVKSNGEPYTVFTPYSRVWKEALSRQGIVNSPSENLMHNFLPAKPLHFPSLEEIGFQKTDVQFSAPELNTDIIRNYHNTRNTPSINGTTRLSIHLRFGTISVREAVKTALRSNEQWLNELIWREFFMMILFHFPRVITQSFKTKYDAIPWRNNSAEFDAWCKGETGYPMVDAGMRELNATGFMHNRVRMVVASFLTKHLLIDWRWGEAYFAEKLLDYDLSANNGNWQWAAGCGCDAAPYFRVFNPEEQRKKFDPENKYIRKWINDALYPMPIVEHTFARERALRTFKKALEQQ